MRITTFTEIGGELRKANFDKAGSTTRTCDVHPGCARGLAVRAGAMSKYRELLQRQLGWNDSVRRRSAEG